MVPPRPSRRYRGARYGRMAAAIQRRIDWLRGQGADPPTPGALGFIQQEVRALEFALRCMELCKSYGIVAFDQFGGPLWAGQVRREDRNVD